MKCLKKNAGDRYQKISDLKEDLSSLLQGEKPSLRFAYSGRERRIFIGVLVGMTLGATSLVLLQVNKKLPVKNIPMSASTKQLPASDGQPSQSTGESIRQSALESAMVPNVVESKKTSAQDDPVVTKQKILLRNLMKAGKQAADDRNWKMLIENSKLTLPLSVKLGYKNLEGQILWRIGSSYYHLSDVNSAKRYFLMALHAVSGRTDKESKDWEYQALIGLGKVATLNHDYDNAINYFGQAYKSVQTRPPEVFKPKDEQDKQVKHKGICLDAIGNVYAQLNQYSQARIYWRAALKLRPGNQELIKKLRELPSQ